MSNYAICQVGGKQYNIIPNSPFKVDWIGAEKKVEADVLLLVDEQGLSLGKPFLKDKISLEIQADYIGTKIKVSKFHAKANYRRTTGIRPKFSKLIWSVKKTKT